MYFFLPKSKLENWWTLLLLVLLGRKVPGCQWRWVGSGFAIELQYITYLKTLFHLVTYLLNFTEYKAKDDYKSDGLSSSSKTASLASESSGEESSREGTPAPLPEYQYSRSDLLKMRELGVSRKRPIYLSKVLVLLRHPLQVKNFLYVIFEVVRGY